MTDIAYYDIKKGLRSDRLSQLKQLRKEQIYSLQKSIKERGDGNSEILKDLLLVSYTKHLVMRLEFQ